MSDENSVVAEPQPESPAPHASPSFLERYRLHLIGGTAVLLIIVFFMGGIALGMSKRSFEKKFYLDQIAKLKITLSSAVERQDELSQEIKELKIELLARKDHVAELEDKIAAFERKTEKSTTAPTVSGGKVGAAEPASTGDAGLDYVRLKAGDCVMDGSGGATAEKWRECLQKSKK